MNMHVWIIMGLTMVTVGGIVHVFIYPYLSGDLNAEKRQAALRPMAAKRGAERQADAASRRKQITESIKELELRGKRKKQSLETRIAQAGFSWGRNKYIGASLASARGKVLKMTGCTRLDSNSGQTCCITACATAAFCATVRARKGEPVKVRRFGRMAFKLISAREPPSMEMQTTRPSTAAMSRLRCT